MDRDKTIIKVSIQGIIVNMILVVFKAVIGFMTNSIAIILDAVNNLSDALSQVITIVGTKLAAKAPDKKHPFGYGRIEYLTSIIVAALILTAGLTSVKESFDKIIHPEPAEYTVIALIIVAVAVVVKFFFGSYVKTTGEKIESQSLIASGSEALMDSVLSFSTLIAALASVLFHVSLEGILGVILSLFIIKAGAEVLIETLSSLIGDRMDREFSLQLKQKISQYPGVLGAYDLVLHDYGPSRSIGSVHIEVEDTVTARDIHLLSTRIMEDILKEYGIVLTVGLYACNTTNSQMAEMEQLIRTQIKKHEHVKQMHGFYVDFERMHIMFDLVVSFKAKHAEQIAEDVRIEVEHMYTGFACQVNIDRDFSD